MERDVATAQDVEVDLGDEQGQGNQQLAARPAARRPENVVEMPNANAPVIVKMSDGVDKLFEAIANAQMEDGYGDIEKSKSARIKMKAGGEYGYTYETLKDVLDATRPFLAKHGVATMQFAFPGQRSVTIRTMLAHKSGQWIYNDLSALIAMPEPKDVGGGISYLRRYALKAITGVAADDEDTAAEDTARRPTAPQPAQRRSQAQVAEDGRLSPPETAKAESRDPHVGTVADYAVRGANVALAKLDTGFIFQVKGQELMSAVESHRKRGTRIEVTCVPSSDPAKYPPVLAEIAQQGS